jgi:hypothetical protein
MKLLLILIMMPLMIGAKPNADFFPPWYQQYKHHKRRANHMEAKFRVMTLRLRIAAHICKEKECFQEAYDSWLPALTFIEKAFQSSFQMSLIIYSECNKPEHLPYCMTMVKEELEYGSHGGYDMFVFKLLSEGRELNKAQQSLLGSSKKVDPQDLHKGLGI